MFELRGWAECPLSSFTSRELATIKQELTYTPPVYNKDEVATSVHGFRTTRLKLFLPIAWAKQNLSGEWKECNALGEDQPPLYATNTITPRTAHQKEFFDKLHLKLVTTGLAFGKANAGSGKTIAGLEMASRLKGRTLVIVPQEDLLDQWKKEAMKHLGLAESDIGIIQQDRCESNRPLCLGLVHSLAKRNYGAEFYKAFRLVVYDEAHMLGARTFSETMGKVQARYKLALSATPDRKDGCEGLFLSYFGSDFVESSQEVMPCHVKTVTYNYEKYNRYIQRSFSLGPCIKAVAENKDRNKFLAGWIKWLHAKGRNILGLSDRISQLEQIKKLLAAEGINAYIYKSTTPKKEKEEAERSARVILATRGMFRQAKNVPRLDAGIELTPSSSPEQELGRIRRILANKPLPLWITPVDIDISFLHAITAKRLRACSDLSGVTVYN